jgi:PAS domain S-box-containing protein
MKKHPKFDLPGEGQKSSTSAVPPHEQEANKTTEMKRAAQALQESEARFRILADSMPQLVWTALPDGTVDYYNLRYKEYSGIAPQGDRDWVWAPVLHDDDVDATVNAWQNAVATEGIYQIEHRAKMADGSFRWHLSRGVPVHDSRGRLVRYFGTATDIHEHRLAMNALAESEERFRSLVNSMDDIVFTLDRQQRFTGLFGGSIKRLNISWKAMIGKRISDMINDDSGLIHEDAARQALNGENILYEWSTDFPSGRVHFQVRMSPLRDREGRVTGVVGVGRDVTEIISAEVALAEYASRLEHSNQELENFAYMASHDLQEPLRKIAAFGKALKESAAGKLNDDEHGYLERMEAATERMQGMISDLLALSRITTETRLFTKVNLADIAREAVSDLETVIENTGGRVIIEDLPVVEADPIQMHSLLLNLIGNGLKYHRPDLRPVVTVRGESIWQEASRRRLIAIRVADNGIGFDEANLERIFRPFVRLHGRSRYEGSGMGLAICSKIVERHGGSITARSCPESGSVFTVILPDRLAG